MRPFKTIAIIMPVYNDESHLAGNIQRAMSELRGLPYDYQIVLVNDGSTDKTRDVIHNIASQYDRISACSHYPNEGKGYSFIKGVELLEFNTKKFDYVLMADSDLQISLYELPAFFGIMKLYNADVVIGNKRHPYSNINYTWVRHVISNGYNHICRYLFGLQIRDTQCGFKLFKRSALDSIRHKIKTRRFAFDIEILLALRERHYRIADAPVYMSRQYNAGSVSLRNCWETLRDTVRIWYRKKRGYYGNP